MAVRRLVTGVAAGLLVSTTSLALTVEHDAVTCAVPDAFPRLEARVVPVEPSGHARAYFRARAGAHWYWVEMTRAGDVMSGVLPKPLKTLAGFDYYIEATDAAFVTARTPEVAVRVEPACIGVGAAAMNASAPAIVVGAAPGVSPLPAGFSASGVVGATASAVSPVLVGIGAAAVGGGTAAVLIVNGGTCEAGQLAVTNARLAPTVFDCPRGSNPSPPYPVTLTVDVRNDSDATVSLRSVTLGYLCADKFPNTPALPCPDQDLGPQSFSPDEVAAGASATVTVGSTRTCTNISTGPPSPVFVDLAARLTFDSSCGPLAVDAGRHRVNAP